FLIPLRFPVAFHETGHFTSLMPRGYMVVNLKNSCFRSAFRNHPRSIKATRDALCTTDHAGIIVWHSFVWNGPTAEPSQ
ncbi:MAG: hypothetical protein ACYCVB_12605, partial [Bacilli bacterium]